MKQNKKNQKHILNSKKVRVLAEVSILLALATVLSIFKLYQLPYGGALTLASMFPLILISYRHGVLVGMGCGLVYGLLQQLLSLSYIQGMTLFSALMVIVLDYSLAFGVIGLGGIFKKACKNQTTDFIYGSLIACFLRYTCHVIAGCTVWAGLSIPTNAAFWYSLLYNAAYMIPEALITVAASYYLSSCIDFKSEMPSRIQRASTGNKIGALNIVEGLVLLFGIIADIVIIFSHTQRDSGEFDITLVTSIPTAHWITVGIITAVSVIASIILHLMAKKKSKE